VNPILLFLDYLHRLLHRRGAKETESNMSFPFVPTFLVKSPCRLYTLSPHIQTGEGKRSKRNGVWMR